MDHTILKEHHEECDEADRGRPGVRPMESAKAYRVTVTATPGTGTDPIKWDYSSNLKNPQNHLVFNKSNDGMKKWDYYLVEFVLDDRTNLGLQFDPNPMKAFWVAMGDLVSPPPCPHEASYSDEIYAICDDPNGRSLTVRNEDDAVQFFSFSLGFIDSSGAPHRYDPIGQNQNGGTSRSQ